MTTFNFNGSTQNITDLNQLQSNKSTLSNLRCTSLTAEQKTILFTQLQDVTTLKSLVIEKSQMSVADATVIARIICNNPLLEKLSLADDNIGPQGIKIIIDAIKSHRSLEVLNLNGNAICSPAARSIQDFIGQDMLEQRERSLFSRLPALGSDLSDDEPFTAESSVLQRMGNCGLMLWHKIVEPDISPVVDLLRDNRKLREICLCRNNLNNNDAQKILDVLRTNTTLTFLDMVGGNNLVLNAYDYEAAQQRIKDIGEIIERNMKNNPDPKAKQSCHYHPRVHEKCGHDSEGNSADNNPLENNRRSSCSA